MIVAMKTASDMNVFDIQDQRRRTLARVKASIAELESVLNASPESPSAYLVKGLIRSLRRNAVVLEAGLPDRRTNSK